MKRFLKLSAIALAVAIVALVIVLRVRYGGPTTPFPDTTKPPLLGTDAVEVVASLDEPPGNIAVAPDGRVFITYHPEARPPLHVMELVNGRPVPYPNAEWQDRFVTPLSLRIDRQGCTDPVRIHQMRVQPFGFEKNLMSLSIAETMNFVF